MSNLAIKEVEFNGDTLMACEDSVNNKVYVGISWVCNGIGLSAGQIHSERKKLKEDIVLSKGQRNFVLPTNGGEQDVICLELDFLPLWLAKISITPKMKSESPEVVDKLVDYQLKAKDVLANAFVKKVPQLSWEDSMIEMLMQSKEIRIKQEAHDEQLKLQQEQLSIQQIQIAEQQNKVGEMTEYISDTPDFKEVERAINVYSRRSGLNQFEIRSEIYKRISDIHGINFKARVKNAQDKLQQERLNDGKKEYSANTLKSKINNMSIIREKGLEKEMIKIIMAMTSELNNK